MHLWRVYPRIENLGDMTESKTNRIQLDINNPGFDSHRISSGVDKSALGYEWITDRFILLLGVGDLAAILYIS